jgi:alpha-mannosidase
VARDANRDPRPLNQLVLYDDHPKYWEAWDIDAESIENGRPVLDAAQHWEVTKTYGGLDAIRVSHRIGRRRFGPTSEIRQTFVLRPGSPRLDIETWIDWRESRTMLRALFPVDVWADFATYEIPFGHIQRSTKRETSEEKARFEVPAHRWMDLSEPGRQRGMALLNDCKYGHSCNGNVMGLTLLRSPKWPDPNADMGTHTFTYSLMPHEGDWRAAGVDREAEAMVRGMWAATCGRSPVEGTIRDTWAPFGVSCTDGASVRVAAVKGAGIVVRLVESHGRAGRCKIEWALPVREVRTVDLLERPREHAGFVHVGGRSEFPIGAFQIVTIRAKK